MKILRPEEVTDVTKLRWDPLTEEELKEAYRLADEAFTAEDLKAFTEPDDEIPMEDLLAELEQQQREIEERNAHGRPGKRAAENL
jgi:hypothetical protein